MRELPILFSGPMVRAIVDGRKTQTRRLVRGTALEWLHEKRFTPEYVALPENEFSPYGYAPGRLWVREAWRTISSLDAHSGSHIAEMCLDAGYTKPWPPIQYEADGHRVYWDYTGTPPHDGEPHLGRYRHGRFMPRWASRITLEVTGVRVERLQGISEADARAEGVERPRPIIDDEPCTYVDAYADLWDRLNGERGYGWDTNPWVWVVEFRRVQL